MEYKDLINIIRLDLQNAPYYIEIIFQIIMSPLYIVIATSGPPMLGYGILTLYWNIKYKENQGPNFLQAFLFIFIVGAYSTFNIGLSKYFLGSVDHPLVLVIFLLLFSIPIVICISLTINKKLVSLNSSYFIPILNISQTKLRFLQLFIKGITYYGWFTFIVLFALILIRTVVEDKSFNYFIIETLSLGGMFLFVIFMVILYVFLFSELVDKSLFYSKMVEYRSQNLKQYYNVYRYKTLYQTLIDEGNWKQNYIGPEDEALEILADQSFSVDINIKTRKLEKYLYKYPIDMHEIFIIGRVFGLILAPTAFSSYKYKKQFFTTLNKKFNPIDLDLFYKGNEVDFFKIKEINDNSGWILANRERDNIEFYFSFEIVKYPMHVIIEKKNQIQNDF